MVINGIATGRRQFPKKKFPPGVPDYEKAPGGRDP
jgi:hypothetical protein